MTKKNRTRFSYCRCKWDVISIMVFVLDSRYRWKISLYQIICFWFQISWLFNDISHSYLTNGPISETIGVTKHYWWDYWWDSKIIGGTNPTNIRHWLDRVPAPHPRLLPCVHQVWLVHQCRLIENVCFSIAKCPISNYQFEQNQNCL